LLARGNEMKTKIRKCIRCGVRLSQSDWKLLKLDSMMPICDGCNGEDEYDELNPENLERIAIKRFEGKFNCNFCPSKMLKVNEIVLEGRSKGIAILRCPSCLGSRKELVIFNDKQI
jgi:NAD-dependent SIR2 family protein deacetylase